MSAHGFLLLASWAEQSAGRFLTTAPASSLTCELRPLHITERVTLFKFVTMIQTWISWCLMVKISAFHDHLCFDSVCLFLWTGIRTHGWLFGIPHSPAFVQITLSLVKPHLSLS